MKRAVQQDKNSSLEKSSKKRKKYPSERKLKGSGSTDVNKLVNLLNEFESPSKFPAASVKEIETIFLDILSNEEIRTKENSTKHNSELKSQYRQWLRECYEDVWEKMRSCLQKGSAESRLQALNSMFNLLSKEASSPLQEETVPCSFPTHRLKMILHALAVSKTLDSDVTKRFSEFAHFRDVSSNVWLALEELLKEVSNKKFSDKNLMHILQALLLLPKPKDVSNILFCNVENVVPEEICLRSAVTKVWKQLSRLQLSPPTHQLLLVVLIEQIMPQMNSPIFLTDYFMDALNREECEIQMLALQGIFNLVIKFNIEYPNIYAKLYQLYTVNTLEAKYKTRLYALTDDFLRSTHLQLALVAAFAKRFSRLLLVATPPDQMVLLTFIVNLLIRHPQLDFLIHNPNAKSVSDDPYKEDEPDPLKSDAMLSQLYEVRLMQNHYSERVAKMACSINRNLPSVELEIPLDLTWNQMYKRDMKILRKKIPQIAENIKPLSAKAEGERRKEIALILSDFDKLFR